jgi:hypothetical protein
MPWPTQLLARALALGALLSLGSVASPGDTITLNNGRVIEAERTWYEGSQLRYETAAGIFGIPRALVAKVERAAAPADPIVVQARRQLSMGNTEEARRILREALARGQRSVALLQTLVEAHLASGDARLARQVADEALALDERDPRTRELLGDAHLALGDRLAAELEYRRSLQLRANPEVSRKLSELQPTPSPPLNNGAQLRIRYDGSVNEPLGAAVLSALGDAFSEYRSRFNVIPTQPVTVVLQTGAEFQEDGRNPEWAGGINDGTIRAPVGGLDRVTPGLLRVLRHELAHSFVAAATRGNCPTWLHEGLAQWLEGGNPARNDATVAAAVRAGRTPGLAGLQGSFRQLSESDATLAYAESLSAVAQILRTRGEPGVSRLLAALSDGLPPEEAFVVALALSYPEFQREWATYLLTLPTR